MTTQIKVPVLPESVADATVSKWYKKPGDAVKRGENLIDLETDKVMLEVPAPEDGVLASIEKAEGTTVKSNEILGVLGAGSAAAVVTPNAKTDSNKEVKVEKNESSKSAIAPDLSPSVRRLVAEHEIDATKVSGSGKAGRVTKEDVASLIGKSGTEKTALQMPSGPRTEQRVPMSRLRARIAERLVAVQQETAMLTTFNEVNMKPVMDLRARYKDSFEKAHGVRLGFMSFFVKAAVEALKRFPAVNASIDGADVVYHGYYDIGIAVSTPRGLVVPVLRDTDTLSMAEIEKAISVFAEKARDNKLTMEEMTGGTFTITNGGVFGSMLSTPILNPPQSAILGMHNIVERPVVESGQIVVRPIMYLAMSYDHRIIDGRESVTFLKTIKEMIEDPARMLLGM